MANRLSSIDRPTVFAPSLRLLAKMGNILAAIEGRYGPPNWKAARSMILDDDVQQWLTQMNDKGLLSKPLKALPLPPELNVVPTLSSNPQENARHSARVITNLKREPHAPAGQHARILD